MLVTKIQFLFITIQYEEIFGGTFLIHSKLNSGTKLKGTYEAYQTVAMSGLFLDLDTNKQIIKLKVMR